MIEFGVPNHALQRTVTWIVIGVAFLFLAAPLGAEARPAGKVARPPNITPQGLALLDPGR